MKLAFLISSIVELLGAIVVYFFATAIFPLSDPLLTKFYALAILVLGIIGISIWRNYSAALILVRHSFLAMMFFHGALAMICFSADPQLLPLRLYACITHLFVFVVFFTGYMKDLRPEHETS